MKLGKSEDQENFHMDIIVVRSNEGEMLKTTMARQAGVKRRFVKTYLLDEAGI